MFILLLLSSPLTWMSSRDMTRIKKNQKMKSFDREWSGNNLSSLAYYNKFINLDCISCIALPIPGLHSEWYWKVVSWLNLKRVGYELKYVSLLNQRIYFPFVLVCHSGLKVIALILYELRSINLTWWFTIAKHASCTRVNGLQPWCRTTICHCWSDSLLFRHFPT